ncbi:MAG: DUF4870 domain-containing protein [Planctomycetota bacterium]
MAQTCDFPHTSPDPGGTDGPANPEEWEQNKDARTWAMFCHLAGLVAFTPILPAFGGVVGALVVWLVKKDESPFVDEQGKEAVNFQITMFIYSAVAALLCFVCIGFVLAPAVVIADIICIILAAVKSNDGEHYQYPQYLIIRFIG